MSELGLTDHLLYFLAATEHKYYLRELFEIYKAKWPVEDKYGNDIDLFIEDSHGSYSWYALQAKVMSPNGSYQDLRRKPPTKEKDGDMKIHIPQWDKLLVHEADFGSRGLYLLYNGMYHGLPGSLTGKRKACGEVPGLNEMGVGIVAATEIKKIRSSMKPYAMLKFHRLFPEFMDPFYCLFCSEGRMKPSKKYERSQIQTSGYNKVGYDRDGVKRQSNDLTTSDNEIPRRSGEAPVRIIMNKGGYVTF